MDTIRCKCDGRNEECIYCGGTGEIKQDLIEIIKTEPDKKALQKQNSELEQYLHNDSEKLYGNNEKNIFKNIRRKKKKVKPITIKELKVEDHLKYIGPNNPHRAKKTFTKRNQKNNNKKR
jgi:hypothetical protein